MPLPLSPGYFYEYLESKQIAARDYQFYSLIMAAMRKADNVNEAKLKGLFPEVWDALEKRYNAPGGALNEDELGFIQHLEAVQ